MGNDDCAADARSSSGLDVDGKRRYQDNCGKACPAVLAAKAARYLLASFSEGRAHFARAPRQDTVGVEYRARLSASACRVVREPVSESGVARTSSVRPDEPESVGRVRLPPHGPPFEAVRDLNQVAPLYRTGRALTAPARADTRPTMNQRARHRNRTG